MSPNHLLHCVVYFTCTISEIKKSTFPCLNMEVGCKSSLLEAQCVRMPVQGSLQRLEYKMVGGLSRSKFTTMTLHFSNSSCTLSLPSSMFTHLHTTYSMYMACTWSAHTRQKHVGHWSGFCMCSGCVLNLLCALYTCDHCLTTVACQPMFVVSIVGCSSQLYLCTCTCTCT